MLGRFAHLGFWEDAGAGGRATRGRARSRTSASRRSRRASSARLSGGEQRRAAIARLLVQAPVDLPAGRAHQPPRSRRNSSASSSGCARSRAPAPRSSPACTSPISRCASRIARCLLSGDGAMRAGRLRGARRRPPGAALRHELRRSAAWARSASWRRAELLAVADHAPLQCSAAIGLSPSRLEPVRRHFLEPLATRAAVPATRSPGCAAGGRAARRPGAPPARVAPPRVPPRIVALATGRRLGSAAIADRSACAFGLRAATSRRPARLRLAAFGQLLARVVGVHQRRDTRGSRTLPSAGRPPIAQLPKRIGLQDRCVQRSIAGEHASSSRGPPAAPVRSVNLPPASSTITVSAAMSRMFTSDSMTTSSAPRASRW